MILLLSKKLIAPSLRPAVQLSNISRKLFCFLRCHRIVLKLIITKFMCQIYRQAYTSEYLNCLLWNSNVVFGLILTFFFYQKNLSCVRLKCCVLSKFFLAIMKISSGGLKTWKLWIFRAIFISRVYGIYFVSGISSLWW